MPKLRTPQPEAHEGALRELAAARLAKSRGERGAEECHLRADASYRVRFDESYYRRARKTLGRELDATVTVEDMIAAMTLWPARRAALAAARWICSLLRQGHGPHR